ncbi:MAG: porin family protein [Gammaproteobacteria bacterium]|nr:porin family protein [Gammaproteobacteria bacterium]
MIKIIKALTLITFALILTTNVYAIDFQLYSGLDYSKINDKTASSSLSGANVRLGLDINKYIAIEGYAGRSNTTVTSYTVSGVTNTDYTYKVNYSSGVVLRGNLRFDRNRAALFGFAGYGYSDANIESASANTKIHISESSPVYGIGLDLYGTKQAALTFTAGTYLDKKISGADTKITSYTLGFTYYFKIPEFRQRY